MLFCLKEKSAAHKNVFEVLVFCFGAVNHLQLGKITKLIVDTKYFLLLDEVKIYC